VELGVISRWAVWRCVGARPSIHTVASDSAAHMWNLLGLHVCFWVCHCIHYQRWIVSCSDGLLFGPCCAAFPYVKLTVSGELELAMQFGIGCMHGSDRSRRRSWHTLYTCCCNQLVPFGSQFRVHVCLNGLFRQPWAERFFGARDRGGPCDTKHLALDGWHFS